MIHDKARVQSIRARIATQVELIKSLQAKIVKGKLDSLEVALKQAQDIEPLFLADLERNDSAPADEGKWLSTAEYMLSIWEPYLKKAQDHFGMSGDRRIEVIGG